MVEQEMPVKYTPSMEDYLEAIANLGERTKAVRVSQIGQVLDVKMPSVTSALKRLSDKELVRHERYGYVELTSKGEEVANETIRRHKALSRFFTEALSIDKKTAEEDACKIEHVISPLSLDRVIKFVEFIRACPQGGANFPKRYQYYLDHGELPEECLERSLRGRK
ncbi:MAG: metal-dependent transcriptional regulator [Chloroflexota bacterium]|nr:metal-dependent transcriptional regulator [Chloroflexota bacterium]